MPQSQERIYTVEDIYALPNGTRAELIDGQIYYMAPPAENIKKYYCPCLVSFLII